MIFYDYIYVDLWLFVYLWLICDDLWLIYDDL